MSSKSKMSRANKLRRKMRRGLVYPAFITLLCVAALVFQSFVIVPKLGEMFLELVGK